MEFQNSSNHCNQLLKKVIFFTLSLSSSICIAGEAKAASFLAEINNFNLTMPDAITNKFGFTLSTGTERNTAPRGDRNFFGDAFADYNKFTVSGPDPIPPVERQITGGSCLW
ncbi:hypothetical protein [Okeania sp. KiyG1]|uniref:hypothetical protein n=1 Tax=Okeania sp. KiyG1 TaxID=2720165 RepID=UPI00192143AC|nr:hypothetical protein [Okeania sp. KiyG1]GGA15275.1 hypothetical protein CYANOKiyG1_29160 [Okeania sp. KiyG1]